MRKVNDLYQKRVIDLRSGNAAATVRDVILSQDARRIVALVVDGRDRQEQIIRWDAIVSVGEYVVADSAHPWAPAPEDLEVAQLREQSEKITGKPVVSTTGERLGAVNDMFFSLRGDLIGFELRQGVFGGASQQIVPADHVQAIGKDAIIVDTTDLLSTDDLDLTDDTPVAPRAAGMPAPTLPQRDPQLDVPPPPRERRIGEPDAPIDPRALPPDDPRARP